jgi:hypothetical protein
MFDQAAFGIYLVCPMEFASAVYGDWGYDLVMLEAGAIAQVLRDEAPGVGLGLCSVGTLDFGAIRSAFRLPGEQLLLHSLVGGCVVEDAQRALADEGAVSKLERAATIVAQLEKLSPEDVAFLSDSRDANGSK